MWELLVVVVGVWVVMPSCVVAHIDVLVLAVEAIVSGWEFFPLDCRRGHVCIGWVVISPCCFTHVSLSFSCALAWSHSCLLPGLHACVCLQWCG